MTGCSLYLMTSFYTLNALVCSLNPLDQQSTQDSRRALNHGNDLIEAHMISSPRYSFKNKENLKGPT